MASQHYHSTMLLALLFLLLGSEKSDGNEGEE